MERLHKILKTGRQFSCSSSELFQKMLGKCGIWIFDFDRMQRLGFVYEHWGSVRCLQDAMFDKKCGSKLTA